MLCCPFYLGHPPSPSPIRKAGSAPAGIRSRGREDSTYHGVDHWLEREFSRGKQMKIFHLTTLTTNIYYGYMASDRQFSSLVPASAGAPRPPPPLPPLLPSHFFSCPGLKNRRRPVPGPVTGVRYNSLL